MAYLNWQEGFALLLVKRKTVGIKRLLRLMYLLAKSPKSLDLLTNGWKGVDMDSIGTPGEKYLAENWEWSMTFRLPAQRFRKEIKRFFRDLMNAESIQVGYIGGYQVRPNRHIHIAAVGYNNNGKSLKDVDRRKWENHWSKITGLKTNSLQIGISYYPEGWEHYLEKNLRSDYDSEGFFYNGKLLQKLNLISKRGNAMRS